MSTHSPARYLAPLALVVSGLAVAALVLGTEKSSTKAVRSRPAALRTHGPLHHFYFVRPGDVLSLIAVRNGVSVSALEALNPGLDPNALHPGQRVKLHRY